MRKYISILAGFTVFLIACNNEGHQLSAEEIAALQQGHNDSVTIMLDSLSKTSIYVPPLYDKQYFDSAAADGFFKLASSTGGQLKLLVNSRLLTNEITRIIQANVADDADLLLMIDKTSSMEDDIEIVKKGLDKIIASISAFKNVHLGIAMYGDKNEDGNDWFSFKDFGTNYSSAQSFIRSITTTGGGDWPESVYDAFFKVSDQNFWRSGTRKMVLLIGDAGSLEKPLADHDVQEVIAKATADKITTNFYPIIVTPSTEEGADIAAMVKYTDAPLISKLYPNPSDGNITVTLATPGTYELFVYDHTGKQVFTDKFTGAEYKKNLDMLQTGAYLLRLISNDKTVETMKFIVQK